jgi:hypothetical protein
MTLFLIPALSQKFSNISDSQVPLIDGSTLISPDAFRVSAYLAGVIVCNRTDYEIRIYYKVSDATTASFQVHNLLVPKNQSLNILDYIKMCNPWLEPTESLSVYSGGASQIFDCTIYYKTATEINEFDDS